MTTQDLEVLLPKLWRFCLGLTRERPAADDLAQATCLRALEQIDSFKNHQFPDRWLLTVARNIWLNQLKAERVRRGGGFVQDDCPELEDLSASPEAGIFISQVFAADMNLPEAQRDTVLLTYVEGYSYKETAAILDVPIGTVMSRLAEARRKLSPLNHASRIDIVNSGQGQARHGSV